MRYGLYAFTPLNSSLPLSKCHPVRGKRWNLRWVAVQMWDSLVLQYNDEDKLSCKEA